MIVVLEGIDNSGKSTLADKLKVHLNWPIQPSEGPPKYMGEMNERLKRYQGMDRTIFDRHPIVSQSIYRHIRTGIDTEGMQQHYIDEFYARQPIFVYCDPGERGMSGHTFHEGVDSEEHLRQVDESYYTLLTHYRRWAIEHAHFIYRIGDDMIAVCRNVTDRAMGW